MVNLCKFGARPPRIRIFSHLPSPRFGHIDKFLQQQASIGVHESSREFSVNLVAAQKKLGKYSLPRRSAWILKFVQSATELGCPELHLKLHKDGIELRFAPGYLPPLNELREGLEKLRPRNQGEDHLFSGLLALHSLDGELYLESAGKRWFPAENRPTESVGDPSLPPKLVYKRSPRSFWEQLKNRLWSNAALLEELRLNCYPAPVQIFVDQRPLLFGEGDIPILSGLIQGEGEAALDYYGQIERETGKRNITFCNWGSSRPPQIGYAVQVRATDSREDSSLSMEWIRSGVVVQRSTVVLVRRRGLLGRILIPTRGLKFDASGFAVKKDDESKAREVKGATYLGTAVEAAKGDLARPRRWEKFLASAYPDASPAKIESLIHQLDRFVDIGKNDFS